MMSTKAIMQLFPEMCDKDGSTVRDVGHRYAMIAHNVGDVDLCIVSGPISGAYGYEMD
jgi:hypothetical protein